ncbi:MAG: hypothetical protein KGZ58_03715 [Ignavibacteriales bacterium]|nr:hypothetical protein [Ignavibacteriales bacterium]
MENILITTTTKNDARLILSLAKKLGFSSMLLSREEKEDVGLLLAMEEGRKSKFVPRSVVMKRLKNGK